MKAMVLVLGMWGILLLIASGWVVNIVKLCKCDFAAPYKSEVVRVIGVFVPPVGMVTGWMELKDGN
jgi:hypothetical protein